MCNHTKSATKRRKEAILQQSFEGGVGLRQTWHVQLDSHDDQMGVGRDYSQGVTSLVIHLTFADSFAGPLVPSEWLPQTMHAEEKMASLKFNIPS